MRKIAIIGGGASGLMAAITAARFGASVTIFEKNERVGKKILQTGNGKCNYTNEEMSVSKFYSSTDNGLIEKVLSDFDEKKVILFFEELGIVPRKRNGGIYPYPETASAVLDVLRMEAGRLGIRLKESANITEIKNEAASFLLAGEQFDRIIISTGGKSAPKTGSDGEGYKLAKKFGHKIIKPLPALTQLKSDKSCFKSLTGVRAEASLSLYIDGKFSKSSHGELQLVNYGLSGICSFELSSIVARAVDRGRKCEVVVNFFEDYSKKSFLELIKKRIGLHGERAAEQLLTGLFNKKLALVFLKEASINLNLRADKISEKALNSLAESVCAFRVPITATGDFSKSQVSSGGVNLTEVNDRLESKKIKGLFFAGEVLDVDGICGGYNLQWAWSSGYCAGKAAAVD